MKKNLTTVYDHKYLLKTSKATKKIKQRSYQLLGNIKNKKVIDLGCGNGLDLLQLRLYTEEGGEVTGIDKNANLLKEAKRNISKTNYKNVQLIHADAENIPFEDGYFDAIRVERVFQHLENPMRVMQEIKRVLKRNGQLVLIETDWASLSMFTNNYEIENKIISHLIYKYTSNGMASRLLVEYLEHINFNQTKTEVFPSIISSYQMTNQLIKLEEIANEVIKSGKLKKEIYLKWLEQIRRSDSKGNFRCSINMLMVSTSKTL